MIFNENKFFMSSVCFHVMYYLGYDIHKQPTDQKCHFYVANSQRDSKFEGNFLTSHSIMKTILEMQKRKQVIKCKI